MNITSWIVISSLNVTSICSDWKALLFSGLIKVQCFWKVAVGSKKAVLVVNFLDGLIYIWTTVTHSTLPYFYPDNYLAKRCAKQYLKICSLSLRSNAFVYLFICPLNARSELIFCLLCFLPKFLNWNSFWSASQKEL